MSITSPIVQFDVQKTRVQQAVEHNRRVDLKATGEEEVGGELEGIKGRRPVEEVAVRWESRSGGNVVYGSSLGTSGQSAPIGTIEKKTMYLYYFQRKYYC